MDRPLPDLAIWTVGTHASGKSAWAATLPQQYPHCRIQVFSDAERALLQQQKDGYPAADVWLFLDTHLSLEDLRAGIAWCTEIGIPDQSLKYFPATPLVHLLRLDSQSPHSVGAAVLREELKQLLPEESYQAVIPSK